MEHRNTLIKETRYNIKFFWENFVISWKSATEYKSNLYSILLLNFTIIPIFLFFGILLNTLVFYQTKWGILEYVLFLYFSEIFVDVVGIFFFGQSLSEMIKNGQINTYLTKPTNVLVSSYCIGRFNPSVFILMNLIIYIPILLYVGYNFFTINFILGVLLLFPIVIMGILYTYFFYSFTWRIIEFGRIFDHINWEVNYGVLGRYPAFFFEKKIIFITMVSMFPMYYISMWIVPLLSFGIFEPKLYELIMFVLVIIISIIGIIVNWKYGLKKYEAFG